MAERNYLKTEAVFLTEKTPKKEVVVTPPLREDSLTVTENGTYQAPIGRGYTDVEVNVQELPEVTSEDNGKVLFVNGGAWNAGLKAELTSQTPLVLEATQVEALLYDALTYIKCSDIAPTETQLLNGGTITAQGKATPITSELLFDLSGQGFNASGLTGDPSDPDPEALIAIFVYEADETFPETGTYIFDQYVPIIDLLTISYPDTITAQARPIAFGTAEYESGVTDMPNGAVYFQLEG